MKLTDLLLKIKDDLLGVYPNADIHFFNITENHDRPSFLINPILNTTKQDNYHLVNRVLSVEVVCFMELESNNKVDYEVKLNLLDNLQSIFGGLNLTIKDRVLKFDYETREINGETSMILDFRFLDDRPMLIENTELMKKVLINEREV